MATKDNRMGSGYERHVCLLIEWVPGMKDNQLVMGMISNEMSVYVPFACQLVFCSHVLHSDG